MIRTIRLALAAALLSSGGALADDDATEREREIYSQVLALVSSAPNAEQQAWLEALARSEPTVMTRWEHDGHIREDARFPYDVLARFVLRRWQVERMRRELAREASPTKRVAASARKADPEESLREREAHASLLRELPTERLLDHRTPLRDALTDTPSLAGAAMEVAQRLADVELMRQVISHGEAKTALQAVVSLDDNFDTDAQLDLLRAALAREEIASAAVFRLAALRDPRANATLLALLGDGLHGPSAAAALGRSDQPELVAALESRTRETADALTARHAALALRLREQRLHSWPER